MTTDAWFGSYLGEASFWSPEYQGGSAWMEHAPFAFWLVGAARPQTFVELGTHSGFSYLAFCQALARLGSSVKAYAVDMWEGDEHSGFYGPEVLAELASYHDPHYGSFSRLVQSTFDGAVESFDDASIDLLHIDGLHTYDAVRHDFETWRPKLSPHAIVVLHDTNVRERGFGVHRLWAELRGDHRTFEFVHAHGLGVVAVGDDVPPGAAALFAADRDPKTVARVRAAYAHLGSAVRLRWELGFARDELGLARDELGLAREELTSARAAHRDYVHDATRRVAAAEAHVESLRTLLADRETELAPLAETCTALQAQLGEAGVRLAASEASTADLRQQLSAFRRSRSWRVTRPLRAGGEVARWISQQRHTPGARFRSTGGTGTDSVENSSAAREGRRTKVLFVSGEPHTPGHDYRVAHVAASLPPRYFETSVVTLGELPARVVELPDVDVLWIWRAAYSDVLARAIDSARSNSAAVVYDVDDLMVRPDVARADVIDGIRSHGWQESAVREFFETVRRAALEATHCCAPTEPLARELRALGKPTTVVPNTFDGAFLRSARAAARQRTTSPEPLVRIGYASGSLTHQRDLAVAVPALARVLRENAHTRFVTFEHAVDIDEFPDIVSLRGQIELRPLVPLERLPDEYARFDVNIAPLVIGNPFCEAKSELKYFEAALAGVATVAAPTLPFAEAIRHGETGFLATEEAEWYETLSLLVRDADLRSRVASAAYRDVLWRFGPERLSTITAGVVQRLVDSPPAAASLTRPALALEARSMPPIDVPEYEVLHESADAAPSRVGVVIPLYNYAAYVEEALESVRGQTLAELDLIVVDDCSTDESCDVARRWLERHGERFNRAALLRNRANSKLARTRNAGIAFADCELFFPLDSDNHLLPTCLEEAIETLDDTGAAFAYPTIELFGEAHGARQESDWDPSLLRFGNYIDAMALIRRACWVAVGGYSPLDLGWEDYDLWCKFVERGFYGVHVPHVGARYRVHGASMLSTTTDVPRNKAEIIRDMTSRHPWLHLAEAASLPAIKEESEGVHSGARGLPGEATTDGAKANEALELDRLLPLLACPETGEALVLHESGQSLVSGPSGRVWPVVAGRPVFVPDGDAVRRHPDEHTSNPLPAEALRLFHASQGPVLNLSAGGTDRRRANVVEVEFSIFTNTDVVADAHRLPFRDSVFEAVVSLNAFEHYHDPRGAAREVWRVLRPGGRLLLRTAFLQPLHEEPLHFFNCTKYGLERWLESFVIEEIGVSENFNPLHTLAWVASDIESGFSEISTEHSAAFRDLRVNDLVGFWRNGSPRTSDLLEMFSTLPPAAQQKTAAGWQALAHKPLPGE